MMCREIISETLRRIFKEISFTNGRWTELAPDQVKSLFLAAVALNFRTYHHSQVFPVTLFSLCEERAGIKATWLRNSAEKSL